METRNQHDTVAILGASAKPERYSHKALEMLHEYGYHVLPIRPACEEILGEKCYPRISAAPGPIDTVTVYLNSTRSTPLIEEIIAAQPKRIILNPGAENEALALRARQAGIEVVEACTLVLLRTGQF